MTIFIITIIAMTLIIKIRSRKQVGSGSTSEQSNHESHTYDPLHSQAEQARHNGGETVIIQYNISGNEETNIIVTREDSVDSVELPPNSDTISTIDNIELPNNDQINSHAVPC